MIQRLRDLETSAILKRTGIWSESDSERIAEFRAAHSLIHSPQPLAGNQIPKFNLSISICMIWQTPAHLLGQLFWAQVGPFFLASKGRRVKGNESHPMECQIRVSDLDRLLRENLFFTSSSCDFFLPFLPFLPYFYWFYFLIPIVLLPFIFLQRYYFLFRFISMKVNFFKRTHAASNASHPVQETLGPILE